MLVSLWWAPAARQTRKAPFTPECHAARSLLCLEPSSSPCCNFQMLYNMRTPPLLPQTPRCPSSQLALHPFVFSKGLGKKLHHHPPFKQRARSYSLLQESQQTNTAGQLPSASSHPPDPYLLPSWGPWTERASEAQLGSSYAPEVYGQEKTYGMSAGRDLSVN